MTGAGTTSASEFEDAPTGEDSAAPATDSEQDLAGFRKVKIRAKIEQIRIVAEKEEFDARERRSKTPHGFEMGNVERLIQEHERRTPLIPAPITFNTTLRALSRMSAAPPEEPYKKPLEQLAKMREGLQRLQGWLGQNAEVLARAGPRRLREIRETIDKAEGALYAAAGRLGLQEHTRRDSAAGLNSGTEDHHALAVESRMMIQTLMRVVRDVEEHVQGLAHAFEEGSFRGRRSARTAHAALEPAPGAHAPDGGRPVRSRAGGFGGLRAVDREGAPSPGRPPSAATTVGGLWERVRSESEDTEDARSASEGSSPHPHPAGRGGSWRARSRRAAGFPAREIETGALLVAGIVAAVKAEHVHVGVAVAAAAVVRSTAHTVTAFTELKTSVAEVMPHKPPPASEWPRPEPEEEAEEAPAPEPEPEPPASPYGAGPAEPPRPSASAGRKRRPARRVQHGRPSRSPALPQPPSAPRPAAPRPAPPRAPAARPAPAPAHAPTSGPSSPRAQLPPARPPARPPEERLPPVRTAAPAPPRPQPASPREAPPAPRDLAPRRAPHAPCAPAAHAAPGVAAIAAPVPDTHPHPPPPPEPAAAAGAGEGGRRGSGPPRRASLLELALPEGMAPALPVYVPPEAARGPLPPFRERAESVAIQPPSTMGLPPLGEAGRPRELPHGRLAAGAPAYVRLDAGLAPRAAGYLEGAVTLARRGASEGDRPRPLYAPDADGAGGPRSRAAGELAGPLTPRRPRRGLARLGASGTLPTLEREAGEREAAAASARASADASREPSPPASPRRSEGEEAADEARDGVPIGPPNAMPARRPNATVKQWARKSWRALPPASLFPILRLALLPHDSARSRHAGSFTARV